MKLNFHTTDLDGLTLVNPDRAERRAILESAAAGADADYPEVYLSLDDGTVLGYRTGGILFQEEAGEVVRVIRGLAPAGADEIWTALIEGGPEALEAWPWEMVDP
jgi:hypothetical protein